MDFKLFLRLLASEKEPGVSPTGEGVVQGLGVIVAALVLSQEPGDIDTALAILT